MPNRRSQLLAQLQAINKRYTSGKAIGNLLSVPTTASLHSIAYLEAAIKYLGFEPIAAPLKKPRGWVKGRPRVKPSQQVVIDYCASLPPGDYSVSAIVDGSGKSRNTVIAALEIDRKRMKWSKDNESS